MGFDVLRSGRNGKLRLTPSAVDLDSDPLFAVSTTWVAATPYVATRHAKRNGKDSLRDDVLREVQRRGLPLPQVSLDEGLVLNFKVAVPGPVLLGKNMHYGGGVFCNPLSV
jgi:CRISPR-associated protein Csb2